MNYNVAIYSLKTSQKKEENTINPLRSGHPKARTGYAGCCKEGAIVGEGVTCDQAFFSRGKGEEEKRRRKICLIHLFCKPPTTPTINKLNCLSTVRWKTEGHGTRVTKGSQFDAFLCIPTTINVFYFHSMQTFKHFHMEFFLKPRGTCRTNG